MPDRIPRCVWGIHLHTRERIPRRGALAIRGMAVHYGLAEPICDACGRGALLQAALERCKKGHSWLVASPASRPMLIS